MDYSKTLNLPKTRFPMRANLPQREPEILARWEEMDIYGLTRKHAAGRPKFILHDGPRTPTVTFTWARPSTRC